MSFETINLIKIDLNSTSIIKFNIKKKTSSLIFKKKEDPCYLTKSE